MVSLGCRQGTPWQSGPMCPRIKSPLLQEFYSRSLPACLRYHAGKIPRNPAEARIRLRTARTA